MAQVPNPTDQGIEKCPTFAPLIFMVTHVLEDMCPYGKMFWEDTCSEGQLSSEIHVIGTNNTEPNVRGLLASCTTTV